MRFLSRLLQQKVKVRYAEKAFESEGQKYAPGTLVITRTGNEALGARFDQLVRAQADSAGTVVTAVKSGFSTTGRDLGSGTVHFVTAAQSGRGGRARRRRHGVWRGVALL